eukprot:COSAG04_NODE_4426_length_2100_cov_2.152424_2_plen_193_part_00
MISAGMDWSGFVQKVGEKLRIPTVLRLATAEGAVVDELEAVRDGDRLAVTAVGDGSGSGGGASGGSGGGEARGRFEMDVGEVRLCPALGLVLSLASVLALRSLALSSPLCSGSSRPSVWPPSASVPGVCRSRTTVNQRIACATQVEVGAEIGRGSFGTVYRGRWRGTDVAVKKLGYDLGNAGERGVQVRARQ